MSVIIGAGSTVVSSQFPNGGIASVNFGFQPNVQRLYQLGSFNPYDSFVQKTRTLQLVVYGKRPDGAGGSLPLDISPSQSCVDAGTVNITVNPASCVGSLLPFIDDYFATGYSYSKEALGYGQENWNFTTKPKIPGFTGTIVMLRGIAEGTVGTGDGTVPAADMGVVINETASNDALGANIEGESGSVQAGTPGIGNFDISRFIIATQVGASTGKATAIDGKTGQANVQIPMTPVFL
jgi:hypothetical protein